jgi:hypothetical protein
MLDLKGPRAGLATIALILVASCGPATIGPPQVAILGQSQDVPGGTGALLYVIDSLELAVTYTFPAGKRKGRIVLSGYGDDYPCSDRTGNVWIPENVPAQIVEYAHGGSKPIQTLRDSAQPLTCAVDQRSGDLAVVNSSSASTVSIYKRARGNPKNYSDAAIEHMYFCGYDRAGNLFVDGTNASKVFKFAELPKGARAFVNLSGVAKLVGAGSVQWDGKYITVTDNSSDVVYRLTISGKMVKTAGTTSLRGADGLLQTWIADGKIVGMNFQGISNSYVAIWNYPAGRMPVKTFVPSSGSSAPSEFIGLTISVSSKR